MNSHVVQVQISMQQLVTQGATSTIMSCDAPQTLFQGMSSEWRPCSLTCKSLNAELTN